MTRYSQLTWADLGDTFDGPHATPQRVEDGPFFLNISSLNDGRLDLSRSDHVSDEEFIKWTRRVTPRPDDLLFSYETRLGEAALMPDGVKACLGRRMALLRPNRDVVHPRFLLYYYLSPAFQRVIEQNTIHGATVNRISLSTMGKWTVSIPPLEEQQAIAEVLGALDDKIAANTKLAETLAETATAYFNLYSQNGGESVPLSEIVTTQYGVTTSSHEDPGPHFLRVTDINKKPWIEWDTTPFCTVSEAEWEKYKVMAGDILVARMADPGKAAFIDPGDPEAVFASYLVRLKSLNPDHALFIYYFLRSPKYRNYAEGAMQGSVQKNMNAKVIVATDISIPDINILRKFNGVVTHIRAQIQGTLRENRKLAQMRDALLPQLMPGKLRVREAEEIVGASV